MSHTHSRGRHHESRNTPLSNTLRVRPGCSRKNSGECSDRAGSMAVPRAADSRRRRILTRPLPTHNLDHFHHSHSRSIVLHLKDSPFSRPRCPMICSNCPAAAALLCLVRPAVTRTALPFPEAAVPTPSCLSATFGPDRLGSKYTKHMQLR